MKTASSIKLSPSALNLFVDCPRCFWLEKNKNIKRPRGIFPSLPGGMDRVIKTYFDGFRKQKKLPPELSGPEFIGFSLFEDQKQLDLWREWKTGPCFKDEDGSVLSGALDDLLVKDGAYVPFDYKTKGSPATLEDSIRYYQNQLDCYALLMEANKLGTAGFGYLLYFSPRDVAGNGQIRFEVQPLKIPVNTERAKGVLRQAVKALQEPLPSSKPSCEYCAWLRNFKTPFK